MKTRIGKFSRRPDVHLIMLVITGNAAINVIDRLIEIYRDGVPASWAVAAVHVLTVALWGLFTWQFELLEKQLKALHQVSEAYRGYKARRAARVD
jgi:hypothetical protein